MSVELTKTLFNQDQDLVPETPYNLAKQEWDNRIGNAVVQAKNWRLIGFGLISIVLGLIFIIIFMANKPKFIPYIIEVNSGAVTNIAKANNTKYVPNEGQLKHHLIKFVEKIRSVSIDHEVNKKWMFEAYSFLTPKTASKFDKYFSLEQEKGIGRFGDKHTVFVTVNSFTAVVNNTYQLQWTEVIHDQTGKLVASNKWVGFATIKIAAPTNETSILQNPLGIWITDFSWSQEEGK